MVDSVYISSDNSLMGEADLACWLLYIINNNLYPGWTFDEITGGCENFLEDEVYLRIKEWFQKYRE